jgi:glyoxylase-like metal-dependent hydrolase (beta-lactamase superfamily II)
LLSDVAPHVRVIALETPTLPPATHTNTYVLGTREVVVVEPASPRREEQERLLEALEASSCRPIAVFLTHHHLDHVGAVEAVRARYRVPVWAHAETARRVAFPVDHHLHDGDAFVCDDGTRWEAVHTPGHAPGHLCLIDPRGTTIAGDLVAGTGTILIEPSEGDMAQYLASLERVAARARLLLPSHGPPLPDAPEVLARYVAHRLGRERKIRDAVASVGPVTLEALLPLAYADAPVAVWPLARLSLEAHLVKLVREEKVVREGVAYRLADAPRSDPNESVR